METENFNRICDGYETKIRQLEDELGFREHDISRMEKEAVCVSHGGHEFEKKGPPTCPHDECKYCGKGK